MWIKFTVFYQVPTLCFKLVNLFSPHPVRMSKWGGYWNIGDMCIKILDITLERGRCSRAPFNSANAPVKGGGNNCVSSEPTEIKILGLNSFLRKIFLIITLGYCFSLNQMFVICNFDFYRYSIHRISILDQNFEMPILNIRLYWSFCTYRLLK